MRNLWFNEYEISGCASFGRLCINELSCIKKKLDYEKSLEKCPISPIPIFVKMHMITVDSPEPIKLGKV